MEIAARKAAAVAEADAEVERKNGERSWPGRMHAAGARRGMHAVHAVHAGLLGCGAA